MLSKFFNKAKSQIIVKSTLCSHLQSRIDLKTYSIFSKMSKIAKRDVGFWLYHLRNALIGREYNKMGRFDSECATRDGPPPNIPEGPAHKLSDNWYTYRDPRRVVEPPVVISSNQKRLTPGDKVAAADGKRTGAPTPGQAFSWD